MDKVRSMMSFSSLPVFFWGYALDTTTYLLNLMPSKWVPLTPKKIWKGLKPNLQHIHIWGCPVHMLKPKVNKLEASSEACQFVGYPKRTREHYFYSQINQKVFFLVQMPDF